MNGLVVAACLGALVAQKPAPGLPAAPGPLYAPASAVAFALADLATVPHELQAHTRYLSLYNLPPAGRAKLAETCSFAVNSLSRERIITRPYPVPGTDGTLLRINLDDYRIDPAAWDRLAEKGSGPTPFPEPYFQEVLDKEVAGEDWEYLRDADGRLISDGKGGNRWRYKTTRKKTLKTARWLAAADGGKAIDALVLATGTRNPILRGDWFVTYALLPPAYYDLLGLGKTLADFEELAVLRRKDAEGNAVQTRGAVVRSEVALHNRALLRSPTILGGAYFWESFDVQQSIQGDDFAANLLNTRRDATEVIASAKNRLQWYFLADGQGKRLDFADPNVAIDTRTARQDKLVRTGYSCAVCHAEGIREIGDEVRLLSRDRIKLLVPDPKDARKVRDLYFADDLTAVVRADQTSYAAAVGACNGLAVAANARQLEQAVVAYERDLGLADVALEVGVPADRLRAVLEASVNLDHTFVGLLQKPERKVRRDQFEAQFHNLQTVLLAAGGKP